MNTWACTRQGELYHHGIKGQKWGVRRFQNKDGSLTPAGERRKRMVINRKGVKIQNDHMDLHQNK